LFIFRFIFEVHLTANYAFQLVHGWGETAFLQAGYDKKIIKTARRKKKVGKSVLY